MVNRLCVIFLFVSVPVFGQTRIYTNADLGQPLRWTAPPVPPEQLQALVANQFKSVPPNPGPQVIVIGGNSTDGPFGPLYLPPTQPLTPPWAVTTYGGWGRYGAGNGYFGVSFGYSPFGYVNPAVTTAFQPVARQIPPAIRTRSNAPQMIRPQRR